MRTPPGQYREYHTSADNLDLIRPDSLVDSLETCAAVMRLLEHNRCYQNTNPNCEPQLARHGLYQGYGRDASDAVLQRAVQWVLNLSDGERSLLDVAERSRMPFEQIERAAAALVKCGLLAACDTAVFAAPVAWPQGTQAATFTCP